MKVRRDISSIPLRTAAATWSAIIDLVRSSGSIDLCQLQAASPVVTSLITDEVHTKAPFTFVGVGPRLVIYLHFGASALEAGPQVDAINWVPTAGDWRLYVPCEEESLSWAREALSEKAPRLVLHDPAQKPAEAKSEPENVLKVDWEGVGS